jgi:hypothetical protein
LRIKRNEDGKYRIRADKGLSVKQQVWDCLLKHVTEGEIDGRIQVTG